jgi:hypothetical protein
MSKKREAYISITNKTGRPILYVGVAHKYSDDYKNTLSFTGPIAPNETTTVDKSFHKVDYHTGAAIGTDWWLVSWCYDDGKQEAYQTAPKNFGGLIDGIEWVTHYAAKGFNFAAGGFLTNVPAWAEKIGLNLAWFSKVTAVASKAEKLKKCVAVFACAYLVENITNTEKISGFKEHMLRVKDAGETTYIEIDHNNKVAFISPSGTSRTISEKIEIPNLSGIS